MTNETAVNPVAGWEVKTVPSHQALILQLGFISTPFQRPDEAQQTPLLALTIEQARELAAVLLRGVEKLENAGTQAPPGARH